MNSINSIFLPNSNKSIRAHAKQGDFRMKTGVKIRVGKQWITEILVSRQ